MKAAVIRRRFLDYFAERGHREVPSSSLVPADDPTLLFTNAGMVQFKRTFQGQEHRDYARATTAQKCVRAGGKHNDLEQVGHTTRHHTFFEMLGNFSFGDYFKRDAIAFAWEFVTSPEWLGIDPERLRVSVHHTDDEARALWREITGLPDDRIYGLGDKDNFWQMGDTGPCGPCSEIYVDLEWKPGQKAPKIGTEEFEELAEAGRFLEIWNLVFMQFDRSADGTLTPLPKPSVDTGAGLERIAAIMQGEDSNFHTDLFLPLLKQVEELVGSPYDRGPAGASYRVLADHARAVSFLLADGCYPEQRGPGLRGAAHPAPRGAARLAAGPAGTHAHAAHAHGHRAARRGVPGAGEECEDDPRLRRGGGAELPRHDRGRTGPHERTARGRRHGDPRRRGIQAVRHLRVPDRPHRDHRGGERGVGRPGGLRGGAGGAAEAVSRLTPAMPASCSESAAVHTKGGAEWRELRDGTQEFVGYQHDTADTEPLAFRQEGERVELLLRENPFYVESGGQVSDTGRLHGEGWVMPVDRVYKDAGRGTVIGGAFRETFEPTSIKAVVDASRRRNIERNHSATHLVHAALRKHLGTHVRQQGSLVDDHHLRFDFSHHGPIEPEALQAIEREVNAHIWQNVPVETRQMRYPDALQLGAMALFSEKYGDQVRVVFMGESSIELCGGTHVRSTGQVGVFQFLSQGGVAAGVRRIEAVTGPEAYAQIEALQARLAQAAHTVKAQPEHLQRKLEQLLEERDKLAARVTELLKGGGAPVQGTSVDIGGVSVTVTDTAAEDKDEIAAVADTFRGGRESAVLVLFGTAGKGAIHVAVTDDLVKSGRKAGDLVNRLAALSGGKGGGRPHFASAGAGDVARLPAAREATPGVVAAWLQGAN